MLGSEDLERLSRDLFSERRIHHSVHCGQCGYNLRMLPYLGKCPECGNEYNARPTVRQGIYVPGELIFPLVELAAAAFFLGWGAAWIAGAVRPLDPGPLVMGVCSALVGGIALVLFIRRVARFIHFRRVAAYIQHHEE